MKGKELRIKELKDNQLVFLKFDFNNIAQCESDREFENELNRLRESYQDGLYKVNLEDKTFMSVADDSMVLGFSHNLIGNIYEWTDKCFCQILDEGKSDKIYDRFFEGQQVKDIIVAGDEETSLRIGKYGNDYLIVGEDYNSISMPIKYCPFCGRKLGED